MHDPLDLDAELQRRAQIRLNKGGAHHALKWALSLHRKGEIRDRSAEGQHYRIVGRNMLAAIIIFWNTVKLGEVVAHRKRNGKPHHTIRWPMSPRLIDSTSISPINRWPKR